MELIIRVNGISICLLLLLILTGCMETTLPPVRENEQTAIEDSEDEVNVIYSLPVSDIEQIILYPVRVWDEEQPLTDEDCAEVIEALRLVEYSGRELSLDDYQGGTDRMFRLELKNGESIVFSACAPFYIIDFKAYKAKYRVCNRIDKEYYRLVEEYFPMDRRPAV